MPTLLQNGVMTIVAHTDDDLLFMNPDIATSIAEGNVATTVFVTAGDAGVEDWYWQSREEGIKAAYALMAGEDDWVDEVVPIDQNGPEYEIASSFLESAPEVRLYFMRIPDGGGFIEDPEDFEPLARLEDGRRLEVDTIDGEATYAREDVVNVLAGLMEAHEPTAFRLQVAEGEGAEDEHSDHIHTTEFALEAMQEFSGDGYTVTHYVNYQTESLAPNLSPQDAAFSLEVMQAYAAFDPATLDADGNLFPIYVAWTGRQYIDETYVVSNEDGEDDDDPVVLSTFTLGDDPDNFYFEIDADTGEITTKDWFVPTRYDALDQDEDFIYNVTRIETPLDGSPATSELIRYEEQTDGPLLVLDDAPADDDPVEDDPSDDDPANEDDPQAAQSTFSLGEHPDNFYFNIDTETGEITTKGWFSSSLLDAWDQNEDYIYEVTRIETPDDGSAPSTELIRFDTEAEGVLAILDDTAPSDDPVEDDPSDDDPVNDDPVATVTYEMSGADAFLFEMNSESGEVSTKDWFVPDFSDPWDQDENNVYEITRTGTDEDGAVASREFISYAVSRFDEMTQLSIVNDILLPLMSGDAAEVEEAVAEPDDAPEMADA